MNKSNTRLFVKQFLTQIITNKVFVLLYLMFMLLAVYCTVSSVKNFERQQEIRTTHQQKARESWEANPDKHPHRMSHFGTFAFRQSPFLSIFDYGIESYTGNAVFLEAHRQNSVNFSDATFSTGSIRFGELNLALLLQLIVPLILFFIGFDCIAADRKNGTLKILITQGAQWKHILYGKLFGLFIIGISFLLPTLLLVIIAKTFTNSLVLGELFWLRLIMIGIGYLVFILIIAAITVLISTRSGSPKTALIRLLGTWLVLFILIPKTMQALGYYLYPTPTLLSFESKIHDDVLKIGDSHNPDDPYYNQMRDSVLKVHQVKEVSDLPFNYSGFVMREGEKITSQLFKKHYADLIEIYEKQNQLLKISSLINPFSAIKQWSIAMSGTGFIAYTDFQKKSDDYRYNLAQTMNNLQMEFINPKRNSSEGKVHVVSHQHWEEFIDFKHETVSIQNSLRESFITAITLLIWIILLFLTFNYQSKNTSAL